MEGKGDPNAANRSNFTSSSSTAEDLLKNQTVGLVQLSDFRKRRAELLDQKDREAQGVSLSRTGTPLSSSNGTPRDSASPQPTKRKKKQPKGKLSFGLQDDEDGSDSVTSAVSTPLRQSPTPDGLADEHNEPQLTKSRLGPNRSVGQAPRVMTKSALLKEAQVREQLRKEFLVIQERVKATEILIPFVFYDGTNIAGGTCRMKKGEHVWLFLDKSKKIGAENAGSGDKTRREWARIGVDDLMLVRGEVIIPHHYDFYYFLVNKVRGPGGLLFEYSAEPTKHTPENVTADAPDPKTYNPLARPGTTKRVEPPTVIDLEGTDDDPTLTKVVDRRWYERNKHIYPASVWEEFDPAKDYSQGFRKDTQGNTFFFS